MTLPWSSINTLKQSWDESLALRVLGFNGDCPDRKDLLVPERDGEAESLQSASRIRCYLVTLLLTSGEIQSITCLDDHFIADLQRQVFPGAKARGAHQDQ